MVLVSASVYFNDSASQFNKDLTDFLKRNIETAILKGGVTFQFKIAKPSDMQDLRRKGIKRLPAMMLENKSYVGVPDIIEEIRRRVKFGRPAVAPKSEDEIVRAFQMEALGKPTKNADGKITFNDEPERDDKEDLLSSFNREIQRRGGAAGHANDGNDDDRTPDPNARLMRPAPPKPSRNQERDNDFEERAPVRQPQRGMMPPMPQRPDNIDNPAMADAFESLNRIKRTASGKEDATDDNMMAALLARLE